MAIKLSSLFHPLTLLAPHTAAPAAVYHQSAIVGGVLAQLRLPRNAAPVKIRAHHHSAPSSRNHILALRKMDLTVGIKALGNIGRLREARRFQSLLDNEPACNDDAAPTTDHDIMAMLALKKEITDTLGYCLQEQYGCDRKAAKREAKNTLASYSKAILNNAEWKTVQASFTHAGKNFTSELVPAGQLKLSDNDIFATSYRDRGISSKSSTETRHAVNLWMSRYTVADGGLRRTLFAGIRHGVLSPYDLEANSQERTQGALNRAKEVLSAALLLHPEKMAQGLAGHTVALHLTSASLLTPVNLGVHTEKSQLDDQMSAWNTLNAGPVVLDIRNHQGKLVPVTVRADIAAFNFGVNELALGLLKLGHQQADKFNLPALIKLLGPDLSPAAPPGGWVGKYLAARPANAARVEALATQLKAIWTNKSHHADGGEPYKAAMRVALLSHEIGIVPCWNCKSGKDRTGMMDAEIKREAAAHFLQGRTGDIGLLDKQGQALMQAVMLNSGNLAIQQYNTGVPGNKSLKNNKLAQTLIGGLTLHDRIGDKAVATAAKGLSDYV
ncbi:inositol phosphate phosphatase SopB [Sodalis sp. RH21]|uniref:inositol phosphate phosphatase SopB n=1 Tax=unclassified Sodalis (in: enterobacteria) TaxID=2636512 RepID=UPI0039B44C0E